MPKYRISAEIRTGRKTVAYRRSKGDFSAHAGDAYLVEFAQPGLAEDWLKFIWRHFPKYFEKISKDPIWKGNKLDNVRLILEVIAEDGSATVVMPSTDWDKQMTVSFG